MTFNADVSAGGKLAFSRCGGTANAVHVMSLQKPSTIRPARPARQATRLGRHSSSIELVRWRRPCAFRARVDRVPGGTGSEIFGRVHRRQPISRLSQGVLFRTSFAGRRRNDLFLDGNGQLRTASEGLGLNLGTIPALNDGFTGEMTIRQQENTRRCSIRLAAAHLLRRQHRGVDRRREVPQSGQTWR
jgi:hypothetical protein